MNKALENAAEKLIGDLVALFVSHGLDETAAYEEIDKRFKKKRDARSKRVKTKFR